MNEKIKQLAKQSRISFKPFIVDNEEYDFEDVFVEDSDVIEKFAELIIEECRTVITEVYKEMPLEQCGWMLHLDEKILERFYGESKN